MQYICTGCKEEFEISKKDFIMCPYCNFPILGKEEYLKVQEEIYSSQYTEKDLEDLLKNEENIYKKMDGSTLEKVKKYIEAMFKLVKDPKAQWQQKLISAAALIYVMNPLDFIPDLIPMLGYADDVGAVMAAIASLGSAIGKCKNIASENKKDKVNKTIVYKLKDESNISKTNAVQKKNLLMWNIPENKRSDIGVGLITGKIMNRNESYVLNRHIGNFLVPVNDFDQYITDNIFNEATIILKALGVKSIKCTKQMATTTDKKIATKGKFQGIFNIENNTDIKGIKVKKDEFESNFEKVDLRESLKNVDFIDKLIWYFSDNSIIGENIFNERFEQGLIDTKIKRDIELSSVLDVESRVNIKKYCDAKHDVNISEGSKVQWSIDVKYHSLSDIDRETLKDIHKNIKSKIEERRLQLEQNL